MMINVRGKARIRHDETAEIYEIDADEVEFQQIGIDERGMGLARHHSAVVEHPQLGQIVWTLWEYPTWIEYFRETDVGPHELLGDVDFGLRQAQPEDDDR